MAVNKTLHDANHETDPKQALLDKIGNLEGKRISGAQVLVATYTRPPKTKTGWQRTDEELKEDIYQGKVGLIVKMGPQAQDLLDVAFDESPSLHDWIFYRISDGLMITINGQECRLLEAKAIRGVTDNPDDIL